MKSRRMKNLTAIIEGELIQRSDEDFFNAAPDPLFYLIRVINL